MLPHVLMNAPPPWTARVLLGLILGGLLLGPAVGESANHGPVAPEDPPLQEALATIDSLRTDREFRAALARLYELSREHPRTVEVLWRYSILWSDFGKAADGEEKALSAYRQALSMAEKALEADPKNAWAHLTKAVAAGRAAKLIGSNRKAIQLSRAVKEHADRAIRLDSTLAPAYHVRGRWHREVAELGFFKQIVVETVYGGLPEASIEQAVADFKRAIALETRAYNHLELGKTYLETGQIEAARRQLQRALDIPPASPFAPEYKLEARELLNELG